MPTGFQRDGSGKTSDGDRVEDDLARVVTELRGRPWPPRAAVLMLVNEGGRIEMVRSNIRREDALRICEMVSEVTRNVAKRA